MKEKKFILTAFLLVCILSFFGTPFLSAAQESYEVPEYEIGDYWIYNHTAVDELSFTKEFKVIGRETIQDYWGSSHECYSLEITTFEVVEHLGEDHQINVTGSSFETVSNLHRVKEETIANYSNLETDDNSSLYSLIYHKTNVSTYQFPMQLGFTTNLNRTSIVTAITGDNGVYNILYIEEETYDVFNYTIYTELEDKSVPAGTFSCVKVTEFQGDAMHNLTETSYYSEEVGRVIYWETVLHGMGTYTVSSSLLEYEYSHSGKRIPGYHLLILIMTCTLIGITLITKKKTSKLN